MTRDFEQDYDLGTAAAQRQIEDLELSQVVDVDGLRHRTTPHVSAAVAIHPAHLRDRADVTARGRARALQRQIVTCVLDRPLLVGDVFFVTFDSTELDAAPSLAVCERCQLLDGPAFETKLRLVQDIAPTSHHD